MKSIKIFTGSTRRVSLGLFLLQLTKAILSFFTVVISSSYFGVSIERDIWLLSLSITTILTALLFGPILEIFRIKFIYIKEKESEKSALRHVGSLTAVLGLISVIIAFISLVAPHFLSYIFAPTYDSSQTDFLNLMIRLFAPNLVLSIIISLLIGVLNAYSVFYIPEIMSLMSSIINVLMIIFFANSIGIYSLVISTYISNVLLIIVLFSVLKKNKISLLQNLNFRISYTLAFIKFALPFYFTHFVSQILLATEKIISTLIGVGSVSTLDYARKFVSIPISVIQSTINVVLATSLAKTFLNEGEKAYVIEFNKFVDLALFASLPLVVTFVICPVDIVSIFLLRGSFDATFLTPTSNCLFWFGFGIISIVFYSTSAQALVAKNKVKITALISGTIGFLILVINYFFYKSFGVQTLAFSWSLIHLVSGIAMYLLVSRSELNLLLKNLFHKAVLVSIVLVLSHFFYSTFKHYAGNSTSIADNIVCLLVTFLFSIGCELSFIYLLRFEERNAITSLFRSTILRLYS